MEEKVTLNRKIRYYKKKKNTILIVLSFSFVLIIGSFITLLSLPSISMELIMSIYLPIFLVYPFALVYFRSKQEFYLMQYNYLLMLQVQREPIYIDKPIMGKDWIDSLVKDGFKIAVDEQHFSILHQVFTRTAEVGKIKPTLVLIVLAKNSKFNFYGNDIDRAIQYIYQQNESYKKVKNQIVLQFKLYDEINSNHIDEINQIINFKQRNQYLIHITVGYFAKERKIYFLYPEKRYPNRYYYFGVKLVNKYCVKGGS